MRTLGVTERAMVPFVTQKQKLSVENGLAVLVGQFLWCAGIDLCRLSHSGICVLINPDSLAARVCKYRRLDYERQTTVSSECLCTNSAIDAITISKRAQLSLCFGSYCLSFGALPRHIKYTRVCNLRREKTWILVVQGATED
jgi:hypothetical protein